MPLLVTKFARLRVIIKGKELAFMHCTFGEDVYRRVFEKGVRQVIQGMEEKASKKIAGIKLECKLKVCWDHLIFEFRFISML